MNKHFIAFLVFIISSTLLFAQKKDRGTSLDSIKHYKNYLNWQNLDPEQDTIMGVSVDKAYNELLKNKKTKKTIVVAVIDGGVDIEHEDLKGKIWVNTNEIPNNGIDDDKNGYIDDVNGWNFIGNSKGENMTYSHYEKTRIVKRYKKQFENIKSTKTLSEKDAKIYEIYKSCLKAHNMEFNSLHRFKKSIIKEKKQFDDNKKILENYLTTDTLCKKELTAIVPKNKTEKKAKKTLLKFYKRHLRKSEIFNMFLEWWVNPYLDYYLNTDFDARKLIGDNEHDYFDAFYGNNQVGGGGYGSGHGTFVSGLIAANRDNGIGINGIATNVKIMALRVVPDGDEYDKDVALAIKYAVDNGANIINTSFGKYYSVDKYMVDSALQYANDKNVLILNSAGNEALDSDKNIHYPTPMLYNGNVFKNWLSVGASAKENNKNLAGDFSNYGAKTIDFFAPGVNIVSTYPQNTYLLADGTSFSCPIAAGVAALVWSYYPQLTASQLKSVLIKSVHSSSQKVYKPTNSIFRKKTLFSKLSATGGIVNAYKALIEAEKIKNKHNN